MKTLIYLLTTGGGILNISLLFDQHFSYASAYSSSPAFIRPSSGSLSVSPLLRSLETSATMRMTERTSTVLFAKKKKKGGSKKKKKQSGFEWASSFTLKPYEAKKTREIVSAAASIFQNKTGKSLVSKDRLTGSSTPDLPKEIWNAPTACLIMTPEAEMDPPSAKVAYANVAALETVGLGPEMFEQLFRTTSNDEKSGDDNSKKMMSIDLPSEMKGEAKFESGYKKKIVRRIQTDNDIILSSENSSKECFPQDGEKNHDVTILNAQRWVLQKSIIEGGKFITTNVGVAYAWNEWMLGDDIICTPGGNRRTVNLEKLEDAIADQAVVIRELKEVQGLGNKDPAVMEEVKKLLSLKDQLAAISG